MGRKREEPGEGPFDLKAGRPPRDDSHGKEGKDKPQTEEERELVEHVPPAVDEPGFVDVEALRENARGLLEAQGAICNAVTRATGGGPEDAWLWLSAELDVMSGAIARYAARHMRVAAALEKADVVVIATTGAEYALRNAGKMRAHAAAQAEELGDVDVPQTDFRVE
jgi:hypothetical protein